MLAPTLSRVPAHPTSSPAPTRSPRRSRGAHLLAPAGALVAALLASCSAAPPPTSERAPDPDAFIDPAWQIEADVVGGVAATEDCIVAYERVDDGLAISAWSLEGDRLWTAPDSELIALARRELVQLGLADESEIVDGHVIRQVKAYPVYDDHYQQHVETVRRWIEQALPGLHLVGRNGMHKYNNQDHAMMTAALTAENILAGRTVWDVWQVNQDAEYHEAGEDRTLALTERLVPTRASRAA